jgi:hypothetical protein
MSAKDAKRIAKAEAMKDLHAKLRFISRDSDQQSGLTRLEVPIDPLQDPKQCKEWTTVNTPEEITRYLLDSNRKHFGQAQGTPFTVSPLNLQVDFEASTQECKIMLYGNYDSISLDEVTALVVQHFQLLTECDALPSSITQKEMMDKYKFWPKSTTTSPSGRHLGHYRALLPGLQTETEKGQAVDSKCKDLVMMHHKMIDYAL